MAVRVWAGTDAGTGAGRCRRRRGVDYRTWVGRLIIQP